MGCNDHQRPRPLHPQALALFNSCFPSGHSPIPLRKRLQAPDSAPPMQRTTEPCSLARPTPSGFHTSEAVSFRQDRSRACRNAEGSARIPPSTPVHRVTNQRVTGWPSRRSCGSRQQSPPQQPSWPSTPRRVHHPAATSQGQDKLLLTFCATDPLQNEVSYGCLLLLPREIKQHQLIIPLDVQRNH